MGKGNRSIVRQSLVQNGEIEGVLIVDLVFPRKVDKLISDMLVLCYPNKRYHVHYYQFGNSFKAHIKNEKTGKRMPFPLGFSQLQSKIIKQKGL